MTFPMFFQYLIINWTLIFWYKKCISWPLICYNSCFEMSKTDACYVILIFEHFPFNLSSFRVQKVSFSYQFGVFFYSKIALLAHKWAQIFERNLQTGSISHAVPIFTYYITYERHIRLIIWVWYYSELIFHSFCLTVTENNSENHKQRYWILYSMQNDDNRQ